MFAPGGWRDIKRGDWVFLRLPEKTLPDTVPGWPGRVAEIDPVARPRRPYLVSVVSTFGIGGSVLEEVIHLNRIRILYAHQHHSVDTAAFRLRHQLIFRPLSARVWGTELAPHYDALIGLQLLFILAQVWAGIDMPQPVGQELLFLAEHTDPAIVGLISRFNFETFQVLHISLKLSVRRGRISAAQMDVT
jgi:hypothetical protein